jgi:flagellar biosynthesis protein FlhF
MKIKRFFAPDIRKAMKMVKEELGADAVIMSNRSVDGGVEIVAARDFDEQAIHNNLKKQAAKQVKPTENKRVDGDKKPLQIISSPRKKGVDGSVPQNPKRRNTDQYVGYAEKVHLASSQQQSQKIVEKLKVSESAENFVHKSVKEVIEPKKTQQQFSFSVEQLMQEMRHEMRKEMKGIKDVLDARLTEVAWHNDQKRQPTRLDLLRRLADMGFSKKLSVKIANRLGAHKDSQLAFEKAQEMLSGILPIAEDNLLEYGGIAALVGPTGVGKTTTIAKLAAQFILKQGSRQVALITTDNYRIGAHEQLNTYGRILDIPVRVASNAEELRSHINNFIDKRLILIDTAGMSQRDMRLAEQIKTLKQDDIPIKTYLVMSAATQYKAMNEIMDAFKIFEPQAGILTKLDETVTQGETLSAIIEQQLPLSFLTDGQQVPEDIHEPNPISLIKQCVAGADQENGYTNVLSYGDWVAEGYA